MPKICVALDTDIEKALELLQFLEGYPLIFKVGYRLFISKHRKITDKIKERGFELFLDLKLNDIPNTVRDGVISARELGADYLTIHTLSGRKALRYAVEVKENLRLLGVTILTSIDQESLAEIGIKRDIKEEVLTLAKLGIDEGLDGVVCSGQELELLRNNLRGRFLTVVPGIRFTDDTNDDQRRVITPEDALRKGVDILVVGRSIINSKDPIKRLDELYNLIGKGD